MPRKSKEVTVGGVCCRAPECCDMRGMLSFLILHLLSTRDMYGMEVAAEIAKRKADKPNPGTIYPTLKQLESKGLIESYQSEGIKLYRITSEGRDGLKQAKRFFVQAYGDILRE